MAATSASTLQPKVRTELALSSKAQERDEQREREREKERGREKSPVGAKWRKREVGVATRCALAPRSTPALADEAVSACEGAAARVLAKGRL